MPDRIDDGSIADGERLWRRLYPDWIERDAQGNPTRPNSLAFLDRRSGEISVHRAAMTTVEFVCRKHPNHGVAELPAHAARANECRVVADPIVNEPGNDDDPSHVLICPPGNLGQKRLKALAKRLAEGSVVIHDAARPPEGEGP